MGFSLETLIYPLGALILFGMVWLNVRRAREKESVAQQTMREPSTKPVDISMDGDLFDAFPHDDPRTPASRH